MTYTIYGQGAHWDKRGKDLAPPRFTLQTLVNQHLQDLVANRIAPGDFARLREFATGQRNGAVATTYKTMASPPTETNMDIDERLERLTERHEALTQTVELLIKDLSDMKVLVNDIAEGTARLLYVAETREKRISRMEGEELQS